MLLKTFQVRTSAVDAVAFQLLIHPAWIPGAEVSTATCRRKFFFATGYPNRKSRYQTIVDVFNWQVWAASLASALAMLVAMLVTHKALTSVFDGYKVFSKVTGIMINEGLPDRLVTLNTYRSLSLLIMTWIPCACLLSMAYQSNLLSSLVKVQLEKPIDTFQQILDNDITVYYRQNTGVSILLSGNPIPIIQKAYKKRGKPYENPTIEERAAIFKDVEGGKGVLDNTYSSIVSISHRLRIGRELEYGAFPCGYYYGINNPVLRDSNVILQRMIDSGVFQSIVLRAYWRDSAGVRGHYRNVQLEEAWNPLGLEHTAPIFLVPLLLLVAIIPFAIELRNRGVRVVHHVSSKSTPLVV